LSLLVSARAHGCRYGGHVGMLSGYQFGFFFFFFQAEDGIRDSSVTGVQTCALPISREVDVATVVGSAEQSNTSIVIGDRTIVKRSEERRVGKECRSRWSPDDEKKKMRRDCSRLSSARE